MNCVVMIDRPSIARWKRECIERLRENNHVEVRRSRRSTGRSAARFVQALLGGAKLRLVPAPADDGIAAPPDVILDLRDDAGADVPTEIPLERWYFCDADGEALRPLPGSGEIARGSSTFAIQLRARRKDGSDVLLRTGRFKALYAYSRSMDVALGECARWPSIALATRDASPRPAPTTSAQTSPRASLFAFVVRQLAAFPAHVYRHLFLDARWRVGVVNGTPASFLREEYRPKIEWLRDDRHFFADPFVLRCNGDAFILGEGLDEATRNGFIAGVKVAPGGRIGERRTVVRTSSHLSYPYVFRDGDDWYMVPESAAERRIGLYRAIEFPYSWQRVATLIDGIAACDSTLLRHAGRWWLFCTDRSRDANLNLFLFHAPSLTGPWKPHPANPVKTDIASARPAGMPFAVDGVLYRPAQDCARSYGAGIRLHRIAKLSETEYEEEEIAHAPLPGMHTMSYADGIVAVDSKCEIVAAPRVIARRLSELALRVMKAEHAS